MLTKSHLGSFTVGVQGTYTLTVSNAGDAATYGKITLTDTLPAGLGYVSATGTGWACGAAGQLVTCTSQAALAAGASKAVTLKVNPGSAAVPGVTNTARVQVAGDTDPANDSDDDPTTVNPAVVSDTTRPSCDLTGTGTDAQGRKFIQVSVSDTGSGLKSVVATKSVNTTTTWPAFAVGSKAVLLVTGTKINQALSSQVELHVTDVAGNVTDCDPILATLEVGPRGLSEPLTFAQVPGEEGLVTLKNGPRERNVVQIVVNGRRFVTALRGGEERSVDISAALRPGDVNRIKMVAIGTPGSSVEVLIWDGNGEQLTRRDWLPVRQDWKDLLRRDSTNRRGN